MRAQLACTSVVKSLPSMHQTDNPIPSTNDRGWVIGNSEIEQSIKKKKKKDDHFNKQKKDLIAFNIHLNLSD